MGPLVASWRESGGTALLKLRAAWLTRSQIRAALFMRMRACVLVPMQTGDNRVDTGRGGVKLNAHHARSYLFCCVRRKYGDIPRFNIFRRKGGEDDEVLHNTLRFGSSTAHNVEKARDASDGARRLGTARHGHHADILRDMGKKWPASTGCLVEGRIR